jgi:pimeloyl-ACP methyl ester carboxylesterase
MSGDMKRHLPTQFDRDGKQYGEGCLTPESIGTCDEIGFLPERVIPIIFLPGIMGSNLRMTPERQAFIEKNNDITWRPDLTLSEALCEFGFADPAKRQLMFDPEATEVDSYDTDPDQASGSKDHDYWTRSKVEVDANSPMLCNDARSNPRFKSAKRKACERGWGEVFFGSYGTVLNRLETMMNSMFSPEGHLNPGWRDVVDRFPQVWQATEKLPEVTLDDLKQISANCCFPVHVCGYNWLQSNGDSAKKVATRIEAIMADYQKKKLRCEKVIVVTHSMGGLVGRALCHPAYGNIEDKVLGIVHGVQPAIGAAAAYYRMLAGFETPNIDSWLGKMAGRLTNWLVMGDTGQEVMPVLANGCGGMELLPNQAYGNHWLRVVDRKGQTLYSLPEKGDPYEEIYMRDGKEAWWGLLREAWINPAKQPDVGLVSTQKLLGKVREFHQTITPYYHPLSYAHYGCDPQRRAFKEIVWEATRANFSGEPPTDIHPRDWIIHPENHYYKEGKSFVTLKPGTAHNDPGKPPPVPVFWAQMRPAADPGDQTVPVHSADHQRDSGKFKAIFRQTGYEHQASYQDEAALASTLYSIVQIAKTMKWA